MGNNITCPQHYDQDPDSAFKRQNKAIASNPIYKLASIDNTGRLIDAYNKKDGGKDAVCKIIKDEVENEYLYNNGKGQVITEREYVKWYLNANEKEFDENNSQAVINNFEIDKFSKFERHEACWDLNKRGGVGESPIHLLFLMGNKEHSEVGRIIVSLHPKMSLDIYEGREYYGESCLHIAIVNNDIESVKFLVEHGAKVNQRATGQFFLPEDVKHGIGPEDTNYEGYAYYGEYPLAFAACFNHQEIYDYLIEKGANPDAEDSFGNTVLHMAVIVDQPKMYKYAVQHYKKKANRDMINKARLTPLTLASKLGRHTIFLEMLELASTDMWKYSNISCSMYPLAAIDSIDARGKVNPSSALMIIIEGETDEHLDMLQGGVMRQLLDEKWKTFAQTRFLVRLLIAVIHLMMISICVYTRPIRKSLLEVSGPTDIARFVFEVLTCVLCLASLSLEAKEIKDLGFISFLRNYKHAPDQAIYLLSCLLILFCIPFRIAELPEVEDTLLTIAVPGSFMYLLFFARGQRMTGPFVTMVYQMCFRDLRRFGIVYIIFLVGFAQGFYFLFRDVVSDNTEVLKFSTPWDTVMNLFQMTLGEFKYETFNYARYVGLTKFVFFIFMILVPILLLNMLIAMMGNTYHNIITKSEKEWRRQWAKIVVVLERGFFRGQLIRFQQDYSVPFGNENEKERAIVVIKAATKSNAKQSKAAKANWRKSVKAIILQLNLHKQKGNRKSFHLKKAKRRHEKELIRTNTSSSLVGNEPALTSAVKNMAWVHDVDLDHEIVPKNTSDKQPKIEHSKQSSNPTRDNKLLPQYLPPLRGSHPSPSTDQSYIFIRSDDDDTCV